MLENKEYGLIPVTGDEPTAQVGQPGASSVSEEQTPSGTPYQGAGEVKPQEEVKEPGALTEQRILELIQQATKDAVGEGLKRFQSMSDKAEARVRKEIARIEKAMGDAGIELTPEQKRVLEGNTRESIRQELEITEGGSNEGEPMSTMSSPPPAVIAKTNEKMRLLELDYGVSIDEKSDPEAGLVNFSDPDPLRFLQQYENALKAKSFRIKSASSQQASARGSSENVVATQNIGGVKQSLDGKSVDELLEMACPRPKEG